jgi:hypothetical protein
MALLLSSCGFGPFAGCDAAGCESLVSIRLTDTDIQPSETYRLELCVGDVCVDDEITIDIASPGPAELAHGEVDPDAAGEGNAGYGSGELVQGEGSPNIGGPGGRILMWAAEDRIDFHLPDGDYAATGAVTLTLWDSSGAVLVAVEDASVPLERSEPNGRWCPPVCFWGELTI